MTINGPFNFYIVVISVLFIATLLVLNNKSERCKTIFFYVWATILVLTVIFRPYGIARDDFSYFDLQATICPIVDCGITTPSRDYIWYFLISIFKSFLSWKQSILTIACLGLVLKIFVIKKISVNNPLLGLFVYYSLFYIVYDLTLFRSSLSVSYFLLGIFFLVNGRKICGSMVMLTNFLFHIQSALSPLVFIAQRFVSTYRYFIATVVSLFILTSIGFFIQLENIELLGKIPYFNGALHEGLTDSAAVNLKYVPAYYYAITLPILFLSYEVSKSHPTLFTYTASSILLGSFFLWFFASIPVAQHRLFETFFVAAPLIVCSCKPKFFTLCICIILGIFGLYRYLIANTWIYG